MKKICIVVASRANYGRVKSLMKAVKQHPNLDLLLIVGASALLDRFGDITKIIENDGFKINRSIHYVIEGENLTTQAKSTGLGIIELATAFQDLKPDAVVTVADRFETMSTAIASTYLNIPLIHLQGGEISGNIDDRVRHAITKLADVHFVCTKLSAQRVIEMGENPEFVFNFGCPSIDVLVNQKLDINSEIMKNELGAGVPINWDLPYILMLQHPVTTSFGQGFNQVTQTLNAIKAISEYQKIVMWPNIDAGSDDVSKGIRHFRECNMNEPIYYYKNFSPENFARVLKNAICCVGNSSSFIREGSFLGVPAVLVGDRQKNREHGENIVLSEYNTEEIISKMMTSIKDGNYKSDKLFGNGTAGKQIAEQINRLDFSKIK
jgi:UDP-hydrolysing UDP-N-acetyl-D-glucosamine 2-epimerase